ncbi:MAG: uncharacterized protein JWP97_4063 [Labilithrix sp.]|nr:uncharacterized protein [Labilithrix sp.]
MQSRVGRGASTTAPVRVAFAPFLTTKDTCVTQTTVLSGPPPERLPSIPVTAPQTVPPPPAEVIVPAALLAVEAALDGVADALRAWENQPLVALRWRDRTNAEQSGAVEISLGEIKRSHDRASTLTLKFVCKPLRGEAVTLSVRVEPYREGVLKHHVRLVHEGTYRDWICTEQEDDDWKVSARLPKPRGIPVIEQLRDVWFTDGAPARNEIAPRVERTGHPVVDARLKPWWPKYDAVQRDWSLGRTLGGGLAERAADPEEWAAAICSFSIWTILVQSLASSSTAREIDKLLAATAGGLPPAELYVSRRAVDLKPSAVQKSLDSRGLKIPWHVVEAACAALNSGKHVIFTGPPGCGKSKLAGILAQLATGREPMLVTASPAWTSGDLVGRYFPTRSGAGLEFRPGFFLQAVDAGNRWLIIDEFNRANIDECFGELFSALADDVVELPFEEEIEGTTSPLGVPSYGRVRIVPERRAASAEAVTAEAQTVDYPVGASFRIVGTMNDADRAMLHKMSFALLRRFQIIRVEAPPAKVVASIIDAEIKRVTDDLKLEERAYVVRRAQGGGRGQKLEVDAVKDLLRKLFARDPDDLRKAKAVRRSNVAPKEGYTDLVRERVVGLATVLDVIRFVAEGIRAPAENTDILVLDKVGEGDPVEGAKVISPKEHAVATSASFLAMAVALSVFPQLDALTTEARRRAVQHIISVFDEDKVLMRRMEEELVAPAPDQVASPEPTGKLGKAKREPSADLHLRIVEHSDPSKFDADGDRLVSISEFLVEELCQQYRGTPDATDFENLLKPGVDEPS